MLNGMAFISPQVLRGDSMASRSMRPADPVMVETPGSVSRGHTIEVIAELPQLIKRERLAQAHRPMNGMCASGPRPDCNLLFCRSSLT
jgi:hypothetical protein